MRDLFEILEEIDMKQYIGENTLKKNVNLLVSGSAPSFRGSYHLSFMEIEKNIFYFGLNE